MKKAFDIKNKMIAFAVTLYILAIVIAAVTGCPAFAVMPAIIVSAGNRNIGKDKIEKRGK